MTSRRAVLYARYSTANQNDKSVGDQLHECRLYAERNGYIVIGEYSDAAKSGGSILGRDGLLDLLAAAGRKEFDAVIVEALDRMSRDMQDLAGIHKRFRFAGIDLVAVHEGKANTVMVGLRGLVGQLFREDGVEKVKRGMSGVLRSGRSPGGKAYGYKPVPGRPGELAIDPAEAEVVVRIYSRYAAGATPRDIAGELNRDGIAPPRGARWNASTINGSHERGYGILTNPIYDGRIVWNRVTMVRDPDTGKRVSRPNPQKDWQSVDAPQYRIVPAELWASVTARKPQKRSVQPAIRNKRLLSGLLRCGHCGAGMTLYDRFRNRQRIICSQARESGTCESRRRVFLDVIEATVVSGLREQLSAPDVLAEYLRGFREERRAAADAATRNRTKVERQLSVAVAAIDRLVAAVADGVMTGDEARPKLSVLRAERADLETQLAKAQEDCSVIELHPEAVATYRRDLENLSAALADGGTDPELRKSFLALVERVIVTVGEPYQPPTVEIIGRLAALLGKDIAPNGPARGRRNVGVALVAGEGLEPPTRGL